MCVDSEAFDALTCSCGFCAGREQAGQASRNHVPSLRVRNLQIAHHDSAPRPEYLVSPQSVPEALFCRGLVTVASASVRNGCPRRLCARRGL